MKNISYELCFSFLRIPFFRHTLRVFRSPKNKELKKEGAKEECSVPKKKRKEERGIKKKENKDNEMIRPSLRKKRKNKNKEEGEK